MSLQALAVPKHSPLPEFDPSRDGNHFAWLVKTAQQVRAERAQVQMLQCAIRRTEMQREYRLLDPHEAQG